MNSNASFSVGLNAAALLSPLTGIGQYAYQLAKGLQRHPDIHANFFYGNGWSDDIREKPLKHIKTLKTLVKGLVPRTYEASRLYQQYRFNNRAHKKIGGIYHEPNFLAFKCPLPLVLTVHDLSWIRYEHMHPADRVKAMNRFFPPSLERARLIITDSQFVQRELQEVFAIPKARVRVVPLGVEALFQPQSAKQVQQTLTKHGLQYQQFLLAVGTLEPRKNLRVVLRAYQRLDENTRSHYPLVLAGMSGWLNSDLEREMAPFIAKGQVRTLGYVAREELAQVIASSLALIYPSVYEGFGLPPLEAMACAVPTITSNVSSIPEVVGETGLRVDPHDDQALTEAMQTLLQDRTLRDKMGQASLKRSQTFTWQSCVDQTIDVYREVLKNQ